ERLLAGDPLEGPLAADHRVTDLLDVLDAGVIGAAEPDRLDRRVGDHLGDALVPLGLAGAEVARELGSARGVGGVGRPDAAHVAVTHLLPGLNVEAGVEAGTDEAYAETGHLLNSVKSSMRINQPATSVAGNHHTH